MSSSQQELHQSCSSSVSDDHLGEKPVSITLSSSSLTDGLDSNTRASPPNTSICNMSKSDDFVLDKPKFVDKMSSKREASAALAYFESILGALTRTKESIGRATRVAIDCAKFGVATKVGYMLIFLKIYFVVGRLEILFMIMNPPSPPLSKDEY